MSLWHWSRTVRMMMMVFICCVGVSSSDTAPPASCTIYAVLATVTENLHHLLRVLEDLSFLSKYSLLAPFLYTASLLRRLDVARRESFLIQKLDTWNTTTWTINYSRNQVLATINRKWAKESWFGAGEQNHWNGENETSVSSLGRWPVSEQEFYLVLSAGRLWHVLSIFFQSCCQCGFPGYLYSTCDHFRTVRMFLQVAWLNVLKRLRDALNVWRAQIEHECKQSSHLYCTSLNQTEPCPKLLCSCFYWV